MGLAGGGICMRPRGDIMKVDLNHAQAPIWTQSRSDARACDRMRIAAARPVVNTLASWPRTHGCGRTKCPHHSKQGWWAWRE